MYKLSCFESEHRGSSLKSTWVIHEGDALTNFRACARGAKYLLELSLRIEALAGDFFFLFSFYLAGPALVGTISHILHLPF